jgi:hypothetical protein
MDKQYIVGFTESTLEDIQLTLVNAENEEHALDKFALQVGIKEPKFIEYVYDRSVNLSFAENFWLMMESEQEEFDATGNIIIDDEHFKERVRDFFGDNREWASLFIDYYFSDQPAQDDLFPDEMLIFIWFEAEWAEVMVASLEDLPVIE